MNRLWQMMTFFDKAIIIGLILTSIVFIILPVAGALLGASDNQDQVIVIQGAGGFIEKIPVELTYKDEPVIVEVKGPIGISYVEAFKGRVRVKEAPPEDPEKICEKTGWIGQPGPMIICVPNRISVWIEAKESELDGVSW